MACCVGKLPVTEVALGSIDGSNQDFSTSGTYVTGTLYAYYNGQLQQKGCVTELGGTEFEFEVAPLPGDILQVRYLAVV